MRALELEIDKEIDSLFVPALQQAAETEDRSKIAIKNPGPAVASGTNLDLEDLQADIDREIDNLFVPAAGSTFTEQEPSAKRKEIDTALQKMSETRDRSKIAPKIQGPAVAPGTNLDLEDLQADIDREIDNLFVPAAGLGRNEEPASNQNAERMQTTPGPLPATDTRVTSKESTPPASETSSEQHKGSFIDHALEARESHRSGLADLIETFNASYLSVDWELSRENILKFLDALNRLEPFAARSTDAKSVVRLMEIILKRLRDRPHAINSKLVQLIRDSQGLLAHILLTEGETGPLEKQRLKDLFERFNDLRQRALATRIESGKRTIEDTVPKPTATDKLQPHGETFPALFSSAADSHSLLGLRNWMQKMSGSLSKSMDLFDNQIDSMRQIETILEKTPGLAPVAQRLNVVGYMLESQIKRLHLEKGEMIAWIPRITELEAARAREGAKTPAGPASTKAGGATRRESLCLVVSGGKCLALPAGCVLKVARSSTIKRLIIFKRGYATLADFRPCLREINIGLLGEWKNLPREELKSYRFELLRPDTFDRTGTNGQMAVLASDGQNHVLIFADSALFIPDAQIAARPSENSDNGGCEPALPLFTLAFDPSCQVPLPEQLSRRKSSNDGRCRR